MSDEDKLKLPPTLAVDEDGLPLITDEALKNADFVRSLLGLCILQLSPQSRTIMIPRKALTVLNGAMIMTVHDTESDMLILSVVSAEEAAAAQGLIGNPPDKSKWN